MQKNDSLTQDPSWVRKAALFLFGQNVSLFGSSIVQYAIIWHITLETSSGVWIMLTTLCSVLPQILVSLWGGVWADRYNRKWLIMGADGFIALCTLGLAIAFFNGYRSMTLILAVSAVRSFGSGVQMPAVNAFFPEIIPANKLTKVQGINQTLMSVLMLVSPAVGGFVLGTFGIEWTFLIDVTTAAMAIIITSFIKTAPAERKSSGQGVYQELKEGVAFVFGNPVLKRLTLYYAIGFFLVTPGSMLTPLLIERTFGDDVWRLTLVEITWTVGSLIGGVYIAAKGEFKDKVQAISISFIGFGIAFALLGLSWIYWIFAAIMLVAGFFMPMMSTATTVLIQETVENEMLGRVFSLLQIISASAMPLAIILFGPLADVISVQTILVITGIILAIVGIHYGKNTMAKPTSAL